MPGTCTRRNSCIEVQKRWRGTRCGNASSLHVVYRNRCSRAIRAKLCLQRTNGTYDCSVDTVVAGARAGHAVCSSTGRARYAAVRGMESFACLKNDGSMTADSGTTPAARPRSTPSARPGAGCSSENACIRVTRAQRTRLCTSANGVKVSFQNTCSRKVKVQICVQRQSGQWSCGRQTLSPRGTTSASVCAGTGKYRYDAHRPSDAYSCYQAKTGGTAGDVGSSTTGSATPAARRPAPEPPRRRRPSCTSTTHCLSKVRQLKGVGYCKINKKGTKDFMPVLKNSCKTKIRCYICAKGGSKCVDWTFNANQSLGGWATDFVWCDVPGIQWRCSLADQPDKCVGK